MGRITWDRVVAPDYGSSMQGFRNASEMLGGAITSARAGLKDYDNTRRDRVNKVVAERMSRITDDAAMQEALQTGALFQGINPDLLDASTYEAAMKRPDALLRNEGSRLDNARDMENNTQTKWENTVTRKNEELSRQIAPDIAAVREAHATGDRGKIEAAEAMLSRRMAEIGMRGDQIIDAGRDLNSLQTTDQNQRENDLQYEEGQWDFGVSKEDRAESRFVEATIGRLSEESLTVAESAERLRGLNIPDHLKARIARGLNIPGLVGADDIAGFGSSAGSGHSTPGGLDPSRVMNYQARNLGINEMPENITVGGAIDFGREVNRRGAESSAMGLYQITRSTLQDFAPRVWKGQDWKNKPFDAKAQDEIGKAIFDSSKGSAQALRNRWVSLSTQEAERIRKLPWEQAREVIARKESGANIASMFGPTAAPAQRARQVAMNEVTSDPMVDAYFDNAGNQERVETVAADLLKNDPNFKGMTQVSLENMLEKIQGMADKIAKKEGYPRRRINARQASVLLQNSWGDDTIGNNLMNIFGMGNPSRGGAWEADRAINDDKIEANIRSILGGGVESQANQRDNIIAGEQDDAALQAEIARLIGLAGRAASRGQTDRAEALMAQAEMLQGQTVGIRANQTRTGQGIGPGRRTAIGQSVTRTRLPRRPETAAEARLRERREAAARRANARTRYPNGPKI